MTRVFVLLFLCFSTAAFAAGDYTLVLKDHEFIPHMTKIQSGVSFVLTIRNEDPTPAAFDSTTLGIPREIIEGGATIHLKMPALKPGQYDVFDPFHIGAEGTIIAE